MVRKAVIGLATLVTVAAGRPNPNVALIAKAKTSMANQLLDPSAAQFRDISVHSGANGKIVCGDVNGKNLYGAYVGFKRFIYVNGTIMTGEDPGYGEIAIDCYR